MGCPISCVLKQVNENKGGNYRFERYTSDRVYVLFMLTMILEGHCLTQALEIPIPGHLVQ